MRKSILFVKSNDYGQVNIKLRQLMDEQQLTRNLLAHLINARFEVVDKWYKNRVERIDMDVLARLCFVLQCDAADIIEYEYLTAEEPNGESNPCA